MTFFSKFSQTAFHTFGKKSRSLMAASVLSAAIGLGAITSLTLLPNAAHAQSADISRK